MKSSIRFALTFKAKDSFDKMSFFMQWLLLLWALFIFNTEFSLLHVLMLHCSYTYYCLNLYVLYKINHLFSSALSIITNRYNMDRLEQSVYIYNQ